MGKLLLFDAYALIYRAYYAFINRPMINSKGINTSAVYGFTTTLLDVIKREKPSMAAVVFDPPGNTFRNELYPDYKANRLSTPEEITRSIPVIKTVIEAFNIPVIEIPGYEADDVIGSLAKTGEKEGYEVVMVTPDKDYMQLVTNAIFMLKPGRSGGSYEKLGIKEVNEFFEVDSPAKVIDILALWGDSSDNVPGAPGIGEKTAKELIRQYNSLENLILHVEDLKAKAKNSLIENRELVLLSHKLVTIQTDVPIPVPLDHLILKKWNEPAIQEIFRELEFRTLLGRISAGTDQQIKQGTLFGSEDTSSPDVTNLLTSKTIEHKYIIIHPGSELEKLVVQISDLEEFCFDTETTGINSREAELVGISICFKSHEAYYIPCPADRSSVLTILDQLKPLFSNNKIRKIGQNLKYDIQILLNYSLEVEGEIFDTMIAHYLLYPDLRHNLDYMAEILLKYKMIPIDSLIGKKEENQKNMRDVDQEGIKEYACEDADITWQIYRILKEEIKMRGLELLSSKVEMPLVRVLAEMENEGFKISTENLSAYSSLLKGELIEVETSIYNMAGFLFNINSPKQLGEVLFERLHIAEGAQKTKSKQYSTSEDVLLKLVNAHPIVDNILEYRSLQKLLSTYVDALPKLIDKRTLKIHTSFDQAFVSTGRLSSRNPNLQNIPIRDERGKEIRKAFVPKTDEGILLSADYSQIELRLMAHLSQDENMINAFINNADIHISTAAKIFKVQEQEVTQAMRSKAKTANFGIIYGISAFGLSQRLNISRSEATELIQGYFHSFPKVKLYMENSIRIAKEKGYVETIMGRRRFLPDIHSSNQVVRGVAERNAINAPIQGSAADIIKLAMVNLQNRIRKMKSALILQVHDELILDVDPNELETIKNIVKYEMEKVLTLRVPLIVDMGVGKNWMEAH